MLLEELQRLKDEGKLVSIFSDVNDSNNFSVGYVAGINDSHFILASITPTGEYDGFLLKEATSIYMVSTDSRYIDKLSTLIDINKTKFDAFFGCDDLVQQLLTYAKRTATIVSVELINSGGVDCSGFVEFFNNNICKIQEINEFGEPDGMSTISVSEITKISCDDSNDRPVKLLNESRQQRLNKTN